MKQNDCRFQIETTPSKELMKEAYLAVIYRTWKGWVYIGLALLCLGIAAYNAYDAWHAARMGWGNIWEINLPYILYFLLLGGFITGRLIAAPELGARKYMKRLAAVHGDPSAMKVTYFFSDDAMHSLSSAGQKIDTAYDQIIAVRETVHGIVLVRKLKLFEILDKSRIEGGTLEDFKAFLQEKMSNAKFHWKS